MKEVNEAYMTMALTGMSTLCFAGIIIIGSLQGSAQGMGDLESLLSASVANQESPRDVKGYGYEPCRQGNYRQLIGSDRNPSEERPYYRWERVDDDDIETGWFRFKQHHENAVMPTSCVPEGRCSTDVPMWLDVGGQSMPEEGQEIEARACGHSYSSCCFWEFPARVRNCGDFYVYFLEKIQSCNLFYIAGYCAVPQNSSSQI